MWVCIIIFCFTWVFAVNDNSYVKWQIYMMFSEEKALLKIDSFETSRSHVLALCNTEFRKLWY